MSVLRNFKDFAIRGNMVDLAIGVIIGSAFGNVINSIVQDLKLGSFLGTVVNFLIVALVMFGVVSLLHGRRRRREAEKAAGKELDHTDQLLTDIREEMRGMRKEMREGPGPGR